MTLVALILADYRTGSPLPVSRGEVDVLWCKKSVCRFSPLPRQKTQCRRAASLNSTVRL